MVAVNRKACYIRHSPLRYNFGSNFWFSFFGMQDRTIAPLATLSMVVQYNENGKH